MHLNTACHERRNNHWQSLPHLQIVGQVLLDFIMLLLQGMMSLRVYVLFGKTKLILLVLSPCLVATHIANIVIGIMNVSSGPT